MKNIFLKCCLLICIQQSATAQCTPANTSGVVSYQNLYKVLSQVFTASCTGYVGTVRVSYPNIADNYYVTMQIRDLSNNILGEVKPQYVANGTTNLNFEATKTFTYNFDCQNIALTSGVQYQLVWFNQEGAADPSNGFIYTMDMANVTATTGDVYAGGYAMSVPCCLAANASMVNPTTTYPRDIKGWTVNINASPVTITSSQSQTNASCAACANGSATVTIAGAASYSYVWKKAGVVIGGATSATVNNLLPGNYTCEITCNCSTPNFNNTNNISVGGSSRTITPMIKSFSIAGGVVTVKWLSINGRLNDENRSVISWSVEEEDVTGYEIEKNINGIHYKKVGAMQAAGNGTRSYHFTENVELFGSAYYRIKQTDNTGRISYSTAVKISAGEKSISVYPNPFSDNMTVNSNIIQGVSIADATGRLVKQIQLSKGSNFVNTENLKAGIYMLRTASGEVIKLIKK